MLPSDVSMVSSRLRREVIGMFFGKGPSFRLAEVWPACPPQPTSGTSVA
jgi:hypothetical protein